MLSDDLIDGLLYGLTQGRSSGAIATTAAVTMPTASTATEILARIEAATKDLEARREDVRCAFDPFGKRLMAEVMRHSLPPQRVPNRVHKRRKGQSVQYHRRVQKKWVKRWGTRDQQHAYLVDTSAFDFFPGPRRQVLVLPEGWPVGGR